MQPRLDPLEFSTVCSDVWCGLCLRESVCALPKSLRSRVTHDTKLWKAMCSSPEAKRSESSCTILPSHCIPVGSGSVEWGGLACILSLCVCARMCAHGINTDSFQRWAELKGAHRSRGVLVKLKEDGLKGKIAPKNSQFCLLSVSSSYFSHTNTDRQVPADCVSWTAGFLLAFGWGWSVPWTAGRVKDLFRGHEVRDEEMKRGGRSAGWYRWSKQEDLSEG